VDYLRVRAFPFDGVVGAFLRAHERCFVVEQNRDAQLRSLLAIETGVARDHMTPILDYGGLPLTARFVVDEVTRRLAPAEEIALPATRAAAGAARVTA
jgi:2-oxoglutarate ferredoxin oxidoreductase subunit alpha